MNYEEAIRYLDSFINYEKTGYARQNRDEFRLDKVKRLAELFDNPQESFKSVHVAGTKGKGSVASFTAAILKETGFTVGLYTSPHLVSPRERVKINNEMIKEEEFAFHIERIREALEKKDLASPPTFFELYTILAFDYFREKNTDYGVIEVGLGGRLDATNIITPEVCAISPISYDHTHILGDSLEEIAFEKSGVIKTGGICLSAPQEEAAMRVIKKRCGSLKVELIIVGKDITYEEISHDDKKEIFNINGLLGKYNRCVSNLLGRHQLINASCAAGIAECLLRKGAGISADNIKSGIENTENPGRCEAVGRTPYVVLDGAQNRSSAKALKETIERNFDYRRLILILGISKDKDIKAICEELAPIADAVILTKAKIERAAEPSAIAKHIENDGVFLTESVSEALGRAKILAKPQDVILITGSFFVIGEARRIAFEGERIAV